MNVVQQALGETLKHLRAHRLLWLPFLLTMLAQAVLLSLVWAAPHPPFSGLLAPPIRYAYGDAMLHYPWHLWLLYHVMKHTQLAATLLVGAYMSGLASAMVRQLHEGQTLSIRQALLGGRVRYGRLLLVWAASWAVATGVLEAAARLPFSAAAMMWLQAALLIGLQAVVVYPIAAAVFEDLSWWRALVRGVQETLRYPVSTVAIVAIPSALMVAFALLAHEQRVQAWMTQLAPEIAVACVLARLLVVTVADALLTVGAANLWLIHRKHRLFSSHS
ncbi:MAG: hypothetical protein HY598_02700 [Candidatus Omnitrophica bacterium]|nr:hypothetical protein [Candidatus Omnitrophota bacterium]